MVTRVTGLDPDRRGSGFVSVEQSTFVSDRSIAMIAVRVIHYLKNKRKRKKCEVALKIDMSKENDRVDWT